MHIDINVMISLGSAIVSLGSLFGIFYKIKYQVEELEKKQDKHNNLIERQFGVETSVEVLREMINDLRADVDELKKERANGR